jgi:hypothetical protein
MVLQLFVGPHEKERKKKLYTDADADAVARIERSAG